MSGNNPVIGIDLGTTNSEVAIYENGQVTVIAGEQGRIMPSVVGLDEQGNLLVGQAARNQYVIYPERTIRSVKRRMGEDCRLPLGDRDYSPQEISAIILRRLKQRAEKYLGCAVERAVITVPAYFSDAQRQATREAGEIAGLEVMKIINEPTAAALAYEAGTQELRRVLVYDLGGGTFDVSVVSIQQEVIEVAASHGNNHLGGDDFDQRIVEFLETGLQEEYPGLTISRQAKARLERAAEQAKMTLSDHHYATIEEEYLLEHDGAPVHLRQELSREEYEEMIAGYIDETVAAMHAALRDADLPTGQIDEILLVGGTTRTPLIAQRLEDETRRPVRGEVDPDLCVVCGAAIQGAIIAGDSVSAVLVDVTPYTFGTAALGEVNGEFTEYMFCPVIKRNSPLPVTKSEVFYPVVPGQETIEATVFQGEDPDARNNIEIGRFLVKGLSGVTEDNPILFELALDANGILKATATEKHTGLSRSITIDNAFSRLDEEQLTTARSRIVDLFVDHEMDQAGEDYGEGDEFGEEGAEPVAPGRRSERHPDRQGARHVQARALIDKAESLFTEIEDEDREELQVLIASINGLLTSGDEQRLSEAIDELADIIYFLES